MSGPLTPYRFVIDVAVSDTDLDMQRHLNNAAIVRLFQELRIAYIQDHVVRRRLGMYDGTVVVVADLHCHYESQGSAEDSYRGGTAIVARTEKAYCYDQVLVAGAEERVVARCRVVELFTDGRRVVPIPEPWWAEVERAEGREIPTTTELPLPRVRWDS